VHSLSQSDSLHRKGRGRFAAVALVAGLALAGASLTALPAEAVTAPHHSPNKVHSAFQKLAAQNAALHKTYSAGTYIVRLKAAPASTYDGGVNGFAATRPSAGAQLNAKASNVSRYSTHLRSTQNSVTAKYGVKPFYNYTLAFNGFAAKLTAKQANALAKNPAVSTLVKNQKLKVQAVTPTDPNINPLSSVNYLGIPGYVWGSGGPENAGKGVVLGDIDTGIAPENPSFAGDALQTAVTASTTPSIIDGGGVDTVQFKKSDGGTFSSSIIPNAQGWTRDDLSTKIIAAHYFVNGFGTENLGSTASRGEYISPRDGAGHGSHTASTAAGDYSVSENVAGTDFGKISGVAPAAKIAVYKVCWDGVATDESQDGCATTDMVAAINQAVQDGVDVLNFSIGGSSAQTTFSPTDEAFYNAAAAGIFVAAAGGNAGPDASTLDNASPWETTVAASTIPSYTATASFGDGGPAPIQGASNNVGFGTLPQVPNNSAFVDAKDNVATGSTAAIAGLCGPNSLSAAVANKVVLCDRGTYDRVAKSAEVKRAGGIGMVLLNTPTGAQDTDLDLHSVPTIHINASPSSTLSVYQAAYDAIHAYAHLGTGTVSFAKSADQSPVPQIAGFSSHGPVLADGSDIMKPDVSAPGVSILAAVANAPGADPNWDFYSGTSMATPHVAGLALLYLGKHPKASVAEIQSALMTTATNTKTATGGTVTDPFAQGNGEVNPSKYLNPGLLYLSTKTDWANYLYSVGEVDHTVTGFEKAKKIDPSNLNRASIAIGDLAGTQKVTRTVTAQSTGTYKASISVPGITAKVSPSSLKFTKVGQSKSFSVTFTRTSKAPLDQYSTGFLTWKKSNSSTTVRSAVAIHPTSLQAAAEVDGTGTTGSVKTTVKAGANLKVLTIPLLAGSEVTDGKSSADGTYTDVAATGGHAVYQHPVAAATEEAGGSEYLRFNVHPVPVQDDNTNIDFDLYVGYYADAADVPANPTIADLTAPGVAVGTSATGANNETVEYFPTTDQYNDGGVYVTYVDYFAAPAGTKYAESFTNLTDTSDEGDFDTTPFLFSTSTGKSYSIKFHWTDLNANALYSGFVFYYNTSLSTFYNGTFVQVDTSTPVSASNR